MGLGHHHMANCTFPLYTFLRIQLGSKWFRFKPQVSLRFGEVSNLIEKKILVLGLYIIVEHPV